MSTEMKPERSKALLTEGDLSRIEQRLMRITGAQIEDGHHPVSWQAAISLCQSLRAARAKYDAEEKDHRLTIDTFRQQERIWQQKYDEQEAENAALREQLAEAQRDLELARQSLLQMVDAVEKRQP